MLDNLQKLVFVKPRKEMNTNYVERLWSATAFIWVPIRGNVPPGVGTVNFEEFSRSVTVSCEFNVLELH